VSLDGEGHLTITTRKVGNSYQPYERMGMNAPFFADRGHRQLLAGYYDGNEHGEDVVRWLKGVEDVKGVIGAMYTTWRDKYDAMEEWAAKAWGGR
jgi:hypothetical protein